MKHSSQNVPFQSIKLLSWSESRIPWWIYILPVFEPPSQYGRKHFSSILNYRDKDLTKTACHEFINNKYHESNSCLIKIVEEIYTIIDQPVGWPSCQFIPDDDCDVVFYNDAEMRVLIAEMRIEEKFYYGKIPAEIHGKRGEFIVRLANSMCDASDPSARLDVPK